MTKLRSGTLNGRVTDQGTTRPIEGASVQVVGTILRGTTDVNGEYNIQSVPLGQRTLRVQVIGYTSVSTSVTVRANGAVATDFQLNRATIALDEIIVTGTAGRTEKRAIGNAVSSIRAADITDAAGSLNDVQDLLTARTPGLSVVANSGQAGASSSIRIRGAGSLSAGFEPVYYVDGLRFESRTQDGQSTGNGVVQGTSPLDFINPYDIESIEIIKGPAAATLYGADAAGGVVQIITKKGTRGGSGVQWTASFEYGQSEWTEQVGNPTNFWLCEADDIADTARFPGCSDSAIIAESGTVLGDGRVLLTDNPIRRHANALRTGDNFDYNLSARGGGEAFNYFLSFNRNTEEGVFNNNSSDRTGGRANFGFTPTDKLDINVNFGYVRTGSQQPWNNNSSNGILRNGFRGRARASNDPWEPGFRGLGPNQSNQYDNETTAERTTIGLTTNYRPFGWLENRLTVGLDKQDRKNNVFFPIDTTGRAPFGATAATGSIFQFLPTTHVWTVDYAGTATANLSDQVTSAFSTGVQLNARQRRSITASGDGLVASNINLVGAAANTTAGETFSEQTSLGVFFQEQIGWRDRLFGTAAVRIDDNSAFGSDFSLVAYPKASLSYVISDETFFNLPGIDQLKLRGAWGKAGQAPLPFTADRTFTAAVTTLDDTAVNFLTPSAFGNANLKAETGREFELGLDASLFNGRTGVEFTYYDQKTNDALIAVPDPPSSGFNGEHFENVGTITNTGLEFLFTGTPVVSRNFVWDASLTIATNKNRLQSFNGARDEISFGAFAQVQKHIEGFPLGGYWSADVERDTNGDPVLVNGAVNVLNATDEKEFVGPSLPTREASLTNTFTLFGNLRLYSHFQYKGGGFQWCAICSIRSRVDQNTQTLNDPNADPVDRLVELSLQTKSHISRSDFIKWRELSLTYTLPTSIGSLFRADRVNFTVSGRNLFVWTKYEGTGDPEVSFFTRTAVNGTFSNNGGFSRLDYASLPQVRRLAGSVRVTF